MFLFEIRVLILQKLKFYSRLSDTLIHNLIKISDKLPKEIQKESIIIMSSIMKDIAPKWRLLVLRNVFAQAEDSSFINEIDLFVHHMGPSSHPTVKELLMNEKFKNKTIIANKSGSILCAFAQRTRIKRLVQDEKIVEVVQCSICENIEEPNKSTIVELSQLFGDVFLKLIGHEDKIVQKNMIKSLLKPMLHHQGMK